MVLAELPSRIAEVLEQSADRRIELAHAHRRAGEADLAQSGADDVLAGQEGRTARGARLLAVIVQAHDAFAADAVDIRRRVTHQAVRIGADVRDADVVAEDDEDVRPAASRRCGGRSRLRLCDGGGGRAANCRCGGNHGTAEQDVAAIECFTPHFYRVCRIHDLLPWPMLHCGALQGLSCASCAGPLNTRPSRSALLSGHPIRLEVNLGCPLWVKSGHGGR
jgi:hypothetical protein